jgi:hypothetical protein
VKIAFVHPTGAKTRVSRAQQPICRRNGDLWHSTGPVRQVAGRASRAPLRRSRCCVSVG